MPSKAKKHSFFRSKGFRIFLTAWIAYIFYLQMYGSSCMSNSNSALAASIANEGSFEVDKYRLVSCDLAFYNGHYYSGMAPGISFISVPVYAAGKALFFLVPDSYIDPLFGKIENYGMNLPPDFRGNAKIISDYFPDLSRRQVLEYLLVSGFLLPVFTTSLFSAMSVLLLYLILGYFTRNEKARLLITFLYAFGTLLFPLATEYFQRPIAVSLMFASFFILFRIIHGKSRLRMENAFFAAGLLAGLSVWFDYFHAIIAGLLSLYVFFSLKKANGGVKGFASYFKIKRPELPLLARFFAGIIIPILLLLLYHYAVFDSPFSTPYRYKTVVDDYITRDYPLFPDIRVITHLFEFLLYSPILAFALYGVFKSALSRNPYRYEAVFAAALAIMAFAYATALAIFVVYLPGYLPMSHKRYMLPMIPYAMIFLSLILTKTRISKKSMLSSAIIIVGIISLFFNWTAAQFGGHAALSQYSLEEQKFVAGADFFRQGPSSSFLNAVSEIFGLNALAINIAGLLALAALLLLIWGPHKKNFFANKNL